MQITAEDYAPLKGFFGWMLANEMSQLTSLVSGADPLSALDRLENTSPSAARRGLAMAIGDMVEMFAGASPEDARRIDDSLCQNGLPTLTHVRARFWRKVRSTVKRGKIRNEGEYYVLRNVVDAMPEDEAGKAWAILAAFEASVPSAGAR